MSTDYRPGSQSSPSASRGPVARPDLAGVHEYRPGASAASAQARGAVKLSANENPYGVPGFLRRAGARAAGRVNRYPAHQYADIRARMAGHYGVGENQVTLGNGSDELMQLITLGYACPDALAGQGGAGVIMEHTFSIYRHALVIAGAGVRVIPMPGLSVDVRKIPAIVAAAPGARVLFLCSPNNPTGGYIPETELRWLLDAVPSDVVVVVDQAYADFADAADYPLGEKLLTAYPNLVVLRTLSKVYGLAAARIGVGLSSADIAATLNRIRMPFSLNGFAVELARAALGHRGYYQRCCARICSERRRCLDAVQEMGYAPLPTQANFFTIPVAPDGESFAGKLRERGILVRPLGSFGLPGYVRITIGTPAQNRRLLAALAVLAEYAVPVEHGAPAEHGAPGSKRVGEESNG